MKLKFKKKHFRVAIFGSARTDKTNESYCKVFQLAKLLGKEGIDVVTGGGPGTMEAASAGHKKGRKHNGSHTFGLLIHLPREQRANRHLDIKSEFTKFSERLQRFMELSSAVVVAPGGIGTTLEFFYALQLVQVKKVTQVPIILIGEQWKALVNWMKNYPVKKRFISKNDLDSLFYVKSVKQAHELIMKTKHLKERREKNIFNKLRK